MFSFISVVLKIVRNMKVEDAKEKSINRGIKYLVDGNTIGHKN